MDEQINNNNDGTAASRLSKKDKGRWKKLKRKASRDKNGYGGGAVTNSCFSGLTAKQDWIELQEFHNIANNKNNNSNNDRIPCPFGPSVCLRKSDNHPSGQAAEGFDHRDILANLLLRQYNADNNNNTATSTTVKKKRGRDDDDYNITADSFPIPGWAAIHNPACFEHVAVLQVHLDKEAAAAFDWEQVCQEMEILKQPSSRHSIVKTRTRWFQGPVPKCITESLLYMLRSNNSNNCNSNDSSTTPKETSSMEQLIPRLEELILSIKERRNEGYPLIVKPNITKVSNSRIAPLIVNGSYQLPSLEEAKIMVDMFGLDGVSTGEESDGIANNYVETQSHVDDLTTTTNSLQLPRVFALDCEMVRTKGGNELARITLVQLEQWDEENMTTKVVLDEWVRPYQPVLDYLTEYSGATASILNQTTTRLEQIQAAMLHLIDRRDILIGHSLENDLRAARVIHHRVVDTAVLFRLGQNKCKFSLKHLAATLLRRRIQMGVNHCSEEDAVAAMHLALQRARLGPAFGIRNRSAIPLLDTFCTTQPGITVAVGPSMWLEEHITRQPNGIHALSCESAGDANVKAILAWLTGPKRRARLVVSKLVVSNEKELTCFNKLLVDLTEHMSPTTVVLVAFQRGFKEAKALSVRRKACQDPRSTYGWTEEEEKNWEKTLEACRSGPAIWIGPSNREN